MTGPESGFGQRLARIYGLYTIGFLAFLGLLFVLERLGLPRLAIGYAFLAVTIAVYAGIGLACRTSDPVEYYVAGRRVPALFNGMATAADWMSAASFIGLAGGLYLQGYSGLAYVMGWTGGYVLVALLLAPYLRRFGQYTIPDFLGARYGGHVPRVAGVVIALLCSFTYLVAQVYGVGLITARMTGLPFAVGIFLGLAGMLVCSFLGGMKAVTWTQVAQCIVLVIAYLVPVAWLSVQQTGWPIPQLIYGQQLEKVTQLEERLLNDPREREVREVFRRRADEAETKLLSPGLSLAADRAALERALNQARAEGTLEDIKRAEDALARAPRNEAEAIAGWNREQALNARAAPIVRHGEPFPGKDEKTRDVARRNFLALVFCLMIGTAALPHLLIRSYTASSVRSARHAVTWSLFFILLLYLTAPALAVLVKYVMYSEVVGTAFGSLPAWVQSWSRVDPSLLSISDVNRDGIVQLAEIWIGGDIVVLATPEIAGMPFVVTGLVAAGGLAAALSTADGLLMTISTALSHDVYHRMFDPKASTARRVMLSKVLLLGCAMLASLAAARKPGDILFLVAAAFSLAGAGLFPALVMGIFWRRATGLGALLGMVSGLAVSSYYMVRTQPWLREMFTGVPASAPVTDLWFDIQPVSAAVFGIPVGFAVIVLVSLCTPRPSARTQSLVEMVRTPAA